MTAPPPHCRGPLPVLAAGGIRGRGRIVKLEEVIDFILVKPIAEAQSPRRRMPAMDPPAEVRKKWQEEAAEVPVHVQGQLDKVVNQVGMMQRKMNEHCERTAPAFDALKHTQTTLESKISEERSQRRTVVTDISRLQDQLQVLRGTITTLQDQVGDVRVHLPSHRATAADKEDELVTECLRDMGVQRRNLQRPPQPGDLVATRVARRRFILGRLQPRVRDKRESATAWLVQHPTGDTVELEPSQLTSVVETERSVNSSSSSSSSNSSSSSSSSHSTLGRNQKQRMK